MTTIAVIIFIITFLGIIYTRLPKVNIDRPSAAFFGAVAMILFGALSFEEAVLAIDFNTIALLLGMMIVIAVLELDGFFTFIAEKTISLSKSRNQLLTIIVFVTGIASAFLVNDAVVLLFTPVIIQICRSAKLNPVQYLIAEILASNIGSAMTITGNPQNILIGMQSGIPYLNFLLHLLPVSFIGMILIVFIIKLFFKTELGNKNHLQFQEDEFNYDFKSMKISVPIFAGIIILFFFSHTFNISIPLIALAGASLILIFGKIKPSKVIKEVDWVLLLFFAGLFIVVHGIEKVGVLNRFIENAPVSNNLTGIISLHGLSLVLSQIVSNVPYTILMLPILKSASSDLLWLSLASAVTLAGNATIIGAVANLIVIEVAKKYDIEIRFWQFFKVGVVITFITLIISIIILYLQLKWALL
jgi:Na+/H+ antiporter NhaD/arsenite permease-like protein